MGNFVVVAPLTGQSQLGDLQNSFFPPSDITIIALVNTNRNSTYKDISEKNRVKPLKILAVHLSRRYGAVS